MVVGHVEGDWVALRWRQNGACGREGSWPLCHGLEAPYCDSMICLGNRCHVLQPLPATGMVRLLQAVNFKFVRLFTGVVSMLMSCASLMSPLAQGDCELAYACAYARKRAYVPSVCVWVKGG